MFNKNNHHVYYENENEENLQPRKEKFRFSENSNHVYYEKPYYDQLFDKYWEDREFRIRYRIYSIQFFFSELYHMIKNRFKK